MSSGRRALPKLLGVVVRPFQEFFRLEAASSLLLLGATAAALLLANAPWGGAYEDAASKVRPVVNDGLMTLFFFVVGMEIKRELVSGELRTPAQALLPAFAALGGMLVPAAVFAAFNHGGAGGRGWGIPMATDIAFSMGCLNLVRRRVPYGLVVFLTALAIVDDVGGIVVIAVFYGSGLRPAWLLLAAAVTLLLVGMNRRGVRSALGYSGVGAALWFALGRAGVHPTIAGVVTGLTIPASAAPGADEEAPLTRLVARLHPWVAFAVMPLFALVNSGIAFGALGRSDLAGPVALGTALALLVGKAIGIFGATLAAVKLRLAPMPGDASPRKLLGVSIVGGIGFTVALFIASLAFGTEPALLLQAKLGIAAGSLAAGALGALLLRATGPVHAGASRLEAGSMDEVENAVP